ncbi:hypothetical protein C5167_024648 [Papaver somniferum]|uniref:PWWP domain-containing protein n=1 Tax=Papaver somniferum TaxID=3469 RepID=A0A4Y7JP91_PAPSO|nr:uncharacterized protein LOC113278113 [Papaver somniferum]RZC62904.1 hypothetical protein C5167_024648 [Papaver somniferum]
MKTEGVSKTTNHVKKDARQETELEVNEGGGGLLGKELKLGEVIWVKTNPSSWWPGQIVDAFTVSGTRIPKKREAGEVLVRLYGTYTYLYWNPKKYLGELMEALKVNDGSSTKMFQKALQQEIVYTRSSSLKRKYSDHKENAKDGDLSDRKLKQNKEDNIQKQDNSSTVPKVSSRELRTRKDKGQSGKQDGANSAQRDLSLGTRKEISKNEIPKQDGFRVGPRVLRPRKAQDLPLKLEDVRRTKMKANSGVLSSGGTKKQIPKPDISRQEGKKKGQKADEELAKKEEAGDSEKEVSENPPNLSSRRVRVMQSLGLAAPSESPFKPKRLALN